MHRCFTKECRGRRLVMVGVSLVFAALLVVFRTVYAGQVASLFLLWNMGLALVPLLLSSLLRGRWGAGRGRVVTVAVLVVWLVFLPNAPYLLTDLIHLQATTLMPQWFDVLLYFSCGWNGLVVYYLSLFDVQHYLADRYGHTVGWELVGVFGLSGFGMYVGRYLRWNSWDVLSNPLGLFSDIAAAVVNPLYSLRIWGMTCGYGIFLALGYLVLSELMRGEGAGKNVMGAIR